MHFNTKLS